MMYVFRNGDVHILAQQRELERYGFPDFDKSEWKLIGEAEATEASFRMFADEPAKALKDFLEKGHYTVAPSVFRRLNRLD